MREAKQDFRVASLDRPGAGKTKRLALPSAVARALVELADATPDALLRHRPTAVLTDFWRMRRAGYIVGLRRQDVEVHSDGLLNYRVPWNTKEATSFGRFIAHTLPAAASPAADLQLQLLLRLLLDIDSAGRGPSARQFPDTRASGAAALTLNLAARLF